MCVLTCMHVLERACIPAGWQAGMGVCVLIYMPVIPVYVYGL